jgi:hypothetical protein
MYGQRIPNGWNPRLTSAGYKVKNAQQAKMEKVKRPFTAGRSKSNKSRK